MREFQQRSERWGNNTDAETMVWHFRIERHDASGNRLAPVPVEMRGPSFSGAVSNGDEIRIGGTWRDGTLRANEFTNLTTSARVRAKYQRLRTAAMIVFFIFFAVVAVFVLSNVISMCTAPWPPEPK